MKNQILAAMLLISFSSFSQLCDETAFPYTENFDSGQAPALPECVYSTYSTFASSEIFETIEGNIPGFIGRVAAYNTASGQNTGWVAANLFAGNLQLIEGETYNLSLAFAKSQPGNTANISISVNTPPGAGDFILLGEQEISNEVTSFSQPFTAFLSGSYTISITVNAAPNAGFVYIDDLEVDSAGTMGTADISLEALSIYPNPVKDILTIEHEEVIQAVELYSNLGQLVLSEKPNTILHALNLEKLPAGVYYMNVLSEGNIKQSKILKE